MRLFNTSTAMSVTGDSQTQFQFRPCQWPVTDTKASTQATLVQRALEIFSMKQNLELFLWKMKHEHIVNENNFLF